MTIFRKITVPFIAVLLLCLMLTAPFLYVLSSRMEQTATQAQSIGGAIELSRGLGIILTQARRQTELLANTPAVAAILLRLPTSSPDLSAKECLRVRELLQFSTSTFPAIDVMNVINAQGEVVCSSYPLTEETQRHDRRYFQNAMQGESMMEGPLTSRATGHPVVVLAAPIKVNGQVKGVLSCSIALEKLNTALTKKTTIHRNGSVYVLSSRGQIILHPQHHVLLTSDIFPPERIAAMLSSGQGMFTRERDDGKTVRVAYVALSDPDWLVLYEDTPEQLARIPLTRNIGLLASILPILAALLFLAPALWRVHTNIRSLTHFAQQSINHERLTRRKAKKSVHDAGRTGEPDRGESDLDTPLDLSELPLPLQRAAKRRDELGELARHVLALTQDTARANEKAAHAVKEYLRSRKEILKITHCIDGVGGGVVAMRLDTSSAIIWGSQGYFRLFGLAWNSNDPNIKPEAAPGAALVNAKVVALTQDPLRFVHPEDVPMLGDILTTATRQQSLVSASFRLTRADNVYLPVIMRGTIVGYDGDFPVFLAVLLPDSASQECATAQTAAQHPPQQGADHGPQRASDEPRTSKENTHERST